MLYFEVHAFSVKVFYFMEEQSMLNSLV